MTQWFLLAYFGPETQLPIASALAVAAGFVLATARGAVAWIQHHVRGPANTAARREDAGVGRVSSR
jgi:uncharacterized membrane protein YeiB